MVSSPWEAFGLKRVSTPGVEALESAWTACFGLRPRAPQWLRAKLYREAWRPDSSIVLVDEFGEVAAFFLIGEGSLGSAHGIGLGVRPEWRKQGLARMLIAWSLARVGEDAGLERLTCEAEEALEDLYLNTGFIGGERRTHLLAFARGDRHGTPLNARVPDDARYFWFERCWSRTPQTRRAAWLVGPHGIGLTREPGAWLVHWSTFTELSGTADAALGCVEGGEPVLLYGVPLDHPELASLQASGWQAVQPHTLMQWPEDSLG